MDALDNAKALQLAVLESKLKTRFAFDFENSTLNQKARFSSFLRTVSEPVNADDGKHSFPEMCVCVNAGEIKRNGKGTDQFSQADLGLGCRQSFLSSLSKSWGSFPCLPCRCMANGGSWSGARIPGDASRECFFFSGGGWWKKTELNWTENLFTL